MNLGTLAARNILRNKVRGVLTVLGVAIALVAFLLLRTVVYAFTSGAEVGAKDRIVTRHKVTFILPLPMHYVEEVRQAPGIKTVTWANWFGGKDPLHETEFFGNFAVDPKTYFTVMSEMDVPPDQLAAFQEDRQGAIIGDVLARKMGWKIGDRVNLESGIFATDPMDPWAFTIRGIYQAKARSVDRSSFLFHWDYFNDRVSPLDKDKVGWIMSRVSDSNRTADIGLQLDRLFDSKDTATLSQDERSFNTSFLAGVSAILSAMNLVAGVILLIMMLILGNTIAMGVRERTNEYGTLRAIGFLPGHIVAFILGEAVLLSALGGALGIGLAYPFVQQGMGRWIEENLGQFFPYFRIPTRDAVVAVLITMVLGAIAGVLPALSASRLKVTEALRRVA
jgi:putative ABC transport system permease protein